MAGAKPELNHPSLAFKRYKACFMLIDHWNDHEKLEGFKKPNEYVNLNL